MNNSDLLTIMQIADSSLPTGGYAFSNGLEWMIKTGNLADLTDLREYLKGTVYQLFHFDVPYIASLSRTDRDEAREAAAEYDLMMRVPGVRKASISQGRAWLRLISQLFSENTALAVQARQREWGVKPLFLIVMTLTFSVEPEEANGFMPWREIVPLYTYMTVRDQVSAAVRLGALGPSAAVKLQREIIRYAGELIEDCPEVTYADAVRTGGVPEMAVSGHSRLYSRLFQN